MSVLEAIVLGVVQGLAEFLPVSSSGHLQIFKEVLGIRLADNLTFDMTLHVATVLATVVVLWREVRGLFWDWAMILRLALSAVPVAIVGLCFRDALNALLASPAILLVVGAMMLVTAGLLVLAGLRRRDPSSRFALARDDKSLSLSSRTRSGGISLIDSIIIGIGQAAAVMPGLSRSGTTIATGLLLGVERARVAQFSFLMVIAPILGNVALDAVSGRIGGIDFAPLAAGFVSAFVVGCLACRAMIELVKRSRLTGFAIYCAAVGAGAIVCYAVA